MTLRQLPGALILGLLASLAAHAAGYSDGHAQAGAYHDALFALAAVGGVGLLLVAGVAAFATAGACAQGSVIASRISSLVPGYGAIGLSALAWFAAAESLETSHVAAPIAIIAVLLALATLAIHMLANAAIRMVAELAIAIARFEFAARRPIFARRAYVAVHVPRIFTARQPALRAPPDSARR